jgi:hypothetical protein
VKATDRPGECPACGLSRVAHPPDRDGGCFPSAVALFKELIKAKAEANGAAQSRSEAARLTHELATSRRERDELFVELRHVREGLEAVRLERDTYERLLDDYRKRERDDATRLAHLIETRADLRDAIRGVIEPKPTETPPSTPGLWRCRDCTVETNFAENGVALCYSCSTKRRQRVPSDG